MSYSKFQELCGSCYISRRDIEEEYNANPNKPWSSGSIEYDENKRNVNANKFLDELFLDCEELDLEQLSTSISKYRWRLVNEKVTGGIWSTIGNVSVAIAKCAANSFIDCLRLLPGPPKFDFEDLRKQGKPSPYKNMLFPKFIRKFDGGFDVKGEHHADYQAAADMYEGNLLALLIAREYDFEQYMP